jgi:hypothetical protein
MLKATLLSTLVLVSTTLARPAQVLDEARAAAILSILERAERDGHDVGVVARQLFGGNDEYAPYEIPCPDGFTWVRPADVSDIPISLWRPSFPFSRQIGGQISEDLMLTNRALQPESKTTSSRDVPLLPRHSRR